MHRNEYGKEAAVTLAILATSLLLAKYGLSSRKHFFIFFGAAAFMALAVRRPHWFIYLTVTTAFLTVPQGVKTAYHPGIYTVPFYEFSLVASVIFCALKLTVHRAVIAASLTLAALVALGVVLGTAHHGDQEFIISQSQILLDAAGAIFVAGSVLGSRYQQGVVDTVRRVLWFSAFLVLVSAATGLALVGRSEEAHLGNQVEDATRLITSTQFLALAVVCFSLAVVLPGKMRFRALAPYFAPALLMLLFAFSRNTLIALGVGVVFTLIGSRETVTTFAGRLIAGTVMAGSMALASTFILAGTPLGNFSARQATAFQVRVLGGLTTSSLDADPSILARNRENAAMLARIPDSLLVGHGFGFAYRAGTGVSPGYVLSGQNSTNHFDAVQSRYYVHNLYLWLLGQSGVLGVVLIIVAMVRPVLTALSPKSSKHLALGAVGAAFLAICLVTPMLEDPISSLLIGCVIGALISARTAVQAGENLPGLPTRKELNRPEVTVGRRVSARGVS